MKTIRLALPIALILSLTGCEWWNDSNDSVTVEKNNVYSVTVIDGYLTGAKVWLDINDNNELDAGEPQAITKNGFADIPVTNIPNYTDYPLVAVATAGVTKDADLGTDGATVNKGYLLKSPKGISVVTPLTTLASLLQEEGESVDSSVAKVAAELGLEADDITSDFIENENDTAMLLAKSFVASEIMPEMDGFIDADSALTKANEINSLLTDPNAPSDSFVIVDSNNELKLIKIDASSDSDGDGFIDGLDDFPEDPSEWRDTDKDSIGDNRDTDDDNDDVLDVNDAFPLDKTESVDTDGDKIGNNQDSDDDGDTVADAADAFPLDKTESVDTDGDKIGNNQDTDDDNDNVLDVNDAFPLDNTESVDTDGDNIGDNLDTDDDNDDVLDSDDAFPLDKTESVDTDGDKIGNNQDTDDDNDGVLDTDDAFPLDPRPHITGHYYDKGLFDKTLNYEDAFSNNLTDENVEIHSYIVIEFDNAVDPASITDETVQIKRLHMEDTPFADSAVNNNNIISGRWTLSNDNKSLTFKPAYKPYLDRSTFAYYTESKPNWNGLKPGYEYKVTVSSAITSTEGLALAGNLTWTFQTTDVDYGLYWFKSSTDAVKYVPGREIDASYYAPDKDTLVYAHGWQQESVVADYRREGFNHFVNDTTSGFSGGMTENVDLVSIWKDKSWNFGAFYWNQMADDDDNAKSAVGAAVPYKAESKIWNTTQMRYAVSPYSLTGSSRQDTPVSSENVWEFDRQTVDNPAKPMSALMAEVLESALDEMADNEFRLAGHSLGNQMVHAAAYILNENKKTAALVPDRMALIDPYWAGAKVANDYWDEHPAKNLVSTVEANRIADKAAAIEYQYDPGYSGQPWNEEISRAIAGELVSNDIAIAFYDVSRTSDGFSGLSGVYYGGLNTPERDIAAISYLQTPWIHTDEYKNLGQKHVNGRLWYMWQMAFDAKDINDGFSASTDTASMVGLMNAKNSEKGRWVMTEGQSTATPEDDKFELSHEQRNLGSYWVPWWNSKSWQE